MKKIILLLVLVAVSSLSVAGSIRIDYLNPLGNDTSYMNHNCVMMPSLTKPVDSAKSTGGLSRYNAKCKGWALNQTKIGDEPHDILLKVNDVPFLCSEVVNNYVNQYQFTLVLDCRQTFLP